MEEQRGYPLSGKVVKKGGEEVLTSFPVDHKVEVIAQRGVPHENGSIIFDQQRPDTQKLGSTPHTDKSERSAFPEFPPPCHQPPGCRKKAVPPEAM
jgi:hypothetical protein